MRVPPRARRGARNYGNCSSPCRPIQPVRAVSEPRLYDRRRGFGPSDRPSDEPSHDLGLRDPGGHEQWWSDIDLDARTIRWQGEHEKTGYEHRTPITAMARAVLVEAWTRNPRGGNSPVMPAPKDPFTCMSRSLARDWWKKAEKRAGLDRKRGRGWHSLRQKFA